MGEIKHYLGMDINYQRTNGVVKLSQAKAIDGILARFGMQDCKAMNTPMENKLILQPHDGDTATITTAPYRQIIGCLMYIMLCTRPDIAYPVGVLSKFLAAPTNEHWFAAKRILRYLKGAKELKLSYSASGTELALVAYCDADWASSYDRKSSTGMAIFLDGNLVSYSSKKQSTIALSTTEAEIIVATETMRELLWLRQLLISCEYNTNVPILYCDSQPAIAIAHNTGFSARTKHFDVKYKFLAECIIAKDVTMQYIPTGEMLADALTKSLPRIAFNRIMEKLCMRE